MIHCKHLRLSDANKLSYLLTYLCLSSFRNKLENRMKNVAHCPGASILGGLGEQSPTFLKWGVEGMVISLSFSTNFFAWIVGRLREKRQDRLELRCNLHDARLMRAGVQFSSAVAQCTTVTGCRAYSYKCTKFG